MSFIHEVHMRDFQCVINNRVVAFCPFLFAQGKLKDYLLTFCNSGAVKVQTKSPPAML